MTYTVRLIRDERPGVAFDDHVVGTFATEAEAEACVEGLPPLAADVTVVIDHELIPPR